MTKAGLGKRGMAVAVAMMLMVGSVVAADAPSAGLGAPWPNAQDVSRSPSWHVYVFARDGVKYIQINDASGVVRGGVAASSDGTTTIALPLGLGQVAVSPSPAAAGAVIYDDGATTVTQSDQGITATPSAAAMRAADCTSVADCSKINAQ